MIVLDTTILVYAVGDDHPLRQPCRDVVASLGDGRLAATTTVEVIQEFTHVRARRRGAAEAAARGDDYITLLAPLLQPSERDLRRALDVFVDVESLGVFDAVLAAAALNADHVTGLMTADAAFMRVAGLNVIPPGLPARPASG